MEIRKVNSTRFDVNKRGTQECWMHIVFSDQQVHFWCGLSAFMFPKQLFALGYIGNDFVAFEWENDIIEQMSPADPKFFEWLESCFKQIIKKAHIKDVDSLRET